jgi:hypothetical protein
MCFCLVSVFLTKRFSLLLHSYVHMLDSVITPTAVHMSIYDQCNFNPDFSTLIENIDFVDLADIIDRDSPLTLLAPHNAAWNRITFGTIDGGEIVKKHLLRGLLFLDVLANETQVTSVSGVTLGVELRGPNKNLWVGGGYVYQGDILARNGVLHYIDRVIGEPYETVPPSVSPAPTITAEPTMFVPPTLAPVFTEAVPVNLPPANPPASPNVKNGGQGSSAASKSFLVAALVSMTLAVHGIGMN